MSRALQLRLPQGLVALTRASSSAPSSSGQAGPSTLDKAKRYAEQKESLDEERALPGEVDMSFYPVGTGLGMAAEARIQAAIAGGALEGLKGKGKPLPAEDHSAQFGRVDPLVAAVTRTMGAQNVRPQSLELRDELQRELRHLRLRLRVELEAALGQQQRSPPPLAAAPPHAGSTQRSGDGGWLARLLGGNAAASASTDDGGGPDARQLGVDGIRAGKHAGLQHALEAVERLRLEYNTAVLSDKESLGVHWPLNQQPLTDWAAEVDAALAALRGSGLEGRRGGKGVG